MAFDIGDLIRLSAAFTDPNSNDDPIDPSTVTVLWKDPAGTVTTKIYLTDAEVIRASLGNFHADVDMDTAGEWSSRWEGSGTGQAAEEHSWIVRPKLVQ